MIASFADRETEALFRLERARRIDPRIQRAAIRKLLMLDAATTLDDLKCPRETAWKPCKGIGEDCTASG
jgi:proteic killer suppression protein